MKKVKLFYLQYCPYCKKALRDIEQLKASNEKYKDIHIEMIEESANRTLASSYDYYLVPTFYVDEKKVHEGVCEKEDIKKVFDLALDKK